VQLLGRPQAALVVDLHALLAGGEREPHEAQVVLQRLRFRRPQRARPRQRLGVLQDERGVEQDAAVVAHERGRLHHGIDPAELVVGAEHRQRLVREAQAEELQRDRHAAHVG